MNEGKQQNYPLKLIESLHRRKGGLSIVSEQTQFRIMILLPMIEFIL